MHVEGQSVRYSTCKCPIGRDKCHHMAALLIWVEKNVFRTDVECVWKRAKTPKMEDVAAKTVSEMTPSTTRAGIKRPVTQEDKEWALASLSQLGRFTGMGWILSPETPQILPVKTIDGLVTSPGFIQAEEKALYVLSSLAVMNLEKQQIERATVGQRMHYGLHIARNGSQQATLVWSWQQSSGNLTLLPYSKPCLASTTSKKDQKHVTGESFMNQGQSSNTQSTLVL
ncbi:uncharacterized protein [Paramormyrops kingsleyae]|uniref:uncharacterized protein n=1 Tax=Paramormyrops kingsleyae TaxID=1676925 RepID=UPI003B96B4BE